MARCLLVVEQRLWLRGNGLIFRPGVALSGMERVCADDSVVLRCPDGSTREATIRGTSLVSGPNSAGAVDLLLDAVGKDEVPIGTEVWSVGH